MIVFQRKDPSNFLIIMRLVINLGFNLILIGVEKQFGIKT